MTITNELKTLNKLEAAGFTHEQAKAVVELIKERARRGPIRPVSVRYDEPAETESQERIQAQVPDAEQYKRQRDRIFLLIVGFLTVVAVLGVVYRFP